MITRHLSIFILFFSLCTATAQETKVFKAKPGYDLKHGVKEVMRLKSGLIVFMRVEPTEIIEVAVGIDEGVGTDERIFFMETYNIGKNVKSLLLPKWVKQLDTLPSGFFLTQENNQVLYDERGKKITEFNMLFKPNIFSHFLIAPITGNISNKNYYDPFGGGLIQNYEWVAGVYDLEQNAKEVWRDTITEVEFQNNMIFLKNSLRSEKSWLFDSSMKPVFSETYSPKLLLDSLVMVEDKKTRKFGFVYTSGKVAIPIMYDNLEIDRNLVFTSFDDLIELIQLKQLYIKAVIGDSAYLYNSQFERIYGDVNFDFEMKWTKDRRMFFELKKDKETRGLIDSLGQVIIPFGKWRIELGKSHVLVTWPNTKERRFESAIYNYSGKRLFGESFRKIETFENDIAVFVNLDSGEAFLANLKTEKILTLQSGLKYEEYSEGTFLFRYKDKLYSFYDNHGKFMFEIKADRVDGFFDGKAEVFIGKKSGAVDEQGNWVKPLKKY